MGVGSSFQSVKGKDMFKHYGSTATLSRLFIAMLVLSATSLGIGRAASLPEPVSKQLCPPVIQNVPSNVTVQCDQVPPIPSNVTASSCCAIVSLSVKEDKKIGTICGDDYTLFRTWTATDACGNSSTAVWVVKVIDTVPPVFINPPGDISGECSAIPPIPNITATDNCDQNVFSLLVETQLPGPCFGTYNLTRLWVIRDNCDNAASHVQVVAIKDTKGPTFTMVPADLTLDCNDAVPSAIPGVNLKAQDDCNPNVSITQKETVTPGVCPIFYTITRTFTANDGCGNTATASQKIVVRDDQAPVLSNVPANITVSCNTPPPANPTATDNCDATPTLTVKDENISGGGCGQDVVMRRVWTATDDCGNSSTASQLVTVYIMGDIEFQNVPDDVTVSCDAIPTPPTVTAADACGLPLAVVLTTSTVPGNCAQNYLLVRTWTATDPCGNSAQAIQAITVRDTKAPVLSGVPSDITVSCSGIPNPGTVSSSDACDPAPKITFNEVVSGKPCEAQLITRSWTATDACGNSAKATQKISVLDDQPPVVQNPPQDLTISCSQTPPPVPMLQVTDDCGSGNIQIDYKEFFSGEPCKGQMINRVWTVTDICGNSVVLVQMITILDDAGPTIIPPADMTINCEDMVNLPDPIISDDCDKNPKVTYTESVVTGNCPILAKIKRCWTVQDQCGNTAMATQMVTVTDTEGPVLMFVHPLLAGLSDKDTFKIACDKPVIFGLDAVKVTDNCDPDPEVWMEETLIMTGPCKIFMLCTFVAKDDCGNISTLSFYYLIGDDVPPVLVGVPADLTISCNQNPPPPATVTATDNCTKVVKVNFSEKVTQGNCPEELTIVRTWTAVDSCDNKAIATQTITRTDTEAPTWMPMHPALVGVPSGTTFTFECDSFLVFNAGDMKAKDNCDQNVEVTFSEILTIGDCKKDGFKIKMECTWTATDNCGNSSTFVIYVIISDKTPPVISPSPQDMTISCEQGIPTPPVLSANDNCDGSVPVQLTTKDIPGKCPQEFIRENTWTATDSCGNTATKFQRITVTDKKPPFFTNVPPNLTIECSNPLPTGNPSVADNCDLNVSVSFSEKTINGKCTGEYVVLRQWTATDDCGNIATAQQNINVQDKTAPVISGVPADATVSCDSIPSEPMVTAKDNCDPNPKVTYSVTSTPGNCPSNYILTRKWTATDDCGNVSTKTQKFTVQDTKAPQLSGVPAGITISCDAPIPNPAKVTATDNCDPNPKVSLKEATVPGNCPESYTLVRTWTATDACGNTRTATQTITVLDSQPPVFTYVPASTQVECDDPLIDEEPEVEDNCDSDVDVTLEEIELPGQCEGEFILVRKWTATDNCGNTATAEQVIKAKDTTPPMIMPVHPGLIGVNPGDTIIYECDDAIIFGLNSVKAVDNCDPDPELDFIEDIVKGDCEKDGYLLLMRCKWVATDDCGNSSTFPIVVIITDTTPPVITGVPANLTIECDQPLPSPAMVQATDNCSEPVAVTVSDKTLPGNCEDNYFVIRTWVATDSCGNASFATQSITVKDTEAPEIENLPADLTIECDVQLPPAGSVSVTDNCDPDPTVAFKEAFQQGSCPQEYVLLRIWVVEDRCGNQASYTQKITVVDTKPPILIGVMGDMTVECDQVPSPSPVKAADACDKIVDVLFTETKLPGNCPQSYTLVRTWTATDDCGNQAVHTQKITVNDTQAPVFVILPPNLTVACDQPLPAPSFKAVDNCSQNLTASVTLVGGEPCDSISDYRIIQVSDECGNTAEAIQEILLIDTVPPVFKPYDQKIVVACDQIGNYPAPEAMDNCDDDVEITLQETKLPGKCPQEYSLIRMWIATDDCGNVASALQLISVVDEEGPELIANAPILQGVPSGTELILECDMVPVLGPDAFTAVDNCDPDTDVTFTEHIEKGDCATDGYYLYMECSWSATDDCGNSSTYTIFFKITDTQAPIFSQVPADITIGCGEPIPGDEPAVSDNCDQDPLVAVEDVETQVNCGYTISRTWTATDACGKSAQTTRIIHVLDQDAPEFITTVTDVTINLDLGETVPPVPVVQASDDCSTFTITLQEVDGAGSDCGFIRTRTWTAVDACGNSAQLVQAITALKACPCVNPVIDEVLLTAPDCGAENGSITVVTEKDPSLLSFSWFPANGQSNQTGNGRSGLDKGTYTILVEDPSAANCFSKVSVDLYPEAGCVDTIHVSMGVNETLEVCVDHVLDFPGIPGNASFCGGDTTQVLPFLANGSACLDLEGRNGFTGTTTLCVVHCSTAVPSVCDTTIIIVTINTVQQPCDTVFPSALGELPAPDCQSQALLCLNIPMEAIQGYQVLIEGQPYTGTFASCNGDNAGILLSSGNFLVEITDLANQCTAERTVTVTCPNEQFIAVDDTSSTRKNVAVIVPVLANDRVPQGTEVKTLEITMQPTNGSVSIQSDRQIRYTPIRNYCGPDSFAYRICMDEGICDEAVVDVDVLCKGLVVHTGMSPNGDGINDNFTIDGIEEYPDNELVIFNRWGAQVYSKKGYNNEWSGTWDGLILPDGTYFYMLTDGEGGTYSGYFQINR